MGRRGTGVSIQSETTRRDKRTGVLRAVRLRHRWQGSGQVWGQAAGIRSGVMSGQVRYLYMRQEPGQVREQTVRARGQVRSREEGIY